MKCNFWALCSTASVLQISHFPIQPYFTYCWISHFITQLSITHKESSATTLFLKWKINYFKSGLFLAVSPLVKAHIQMIFDIKAHHTILPDCLSHGCVWRKSTSIWKMNVIYSRNHLWISINLACEGLQSKNQILFYLLIYCLQLASHVPSCPGIVNK